MKANIFKSNQPAKSFGDTFGEFICSVNIQASSKQEAHELLSPLVQHLKSKHGSLMVEIESENKTQNYLLTINEIAKCVLNLSNGQEIESLVNILPKALKENEQLNKTPIMSFIRPNQNDFEACFINKDNEDDPDPLICIISPIDKF
jgi:hypothetical protein